ncbi:hypothetical protein D9V62_02980 [Buchnera aphidicola (Aphis helianthi)]|uniref:Uncharacterized protein n=1 Tax=Buchnera aphidicola (Aphis helianthi) TaxID=2315802 RepID=A0A4D6XRC4_9GAMM|nr:hypothetical protein [Buchnera aphidicola]QCI17378.1 hypothetical protein D9V62_02980 [Buchnera aphidicola (Aphis helianthi)]
MDESTRKVNDKIDSLVKYVEKLKKTIESSKLLIHALIKKIREQGRLKIINKLNHNPKHPEYESSFPDLNYETPISQKIDQRHPNDFDDSFDFKLKLRNIKLNKNFQDKINKTIKNSHYDFEKNKDIWTIFDKKEESSSEENDTTTISSYSPMYEKLEVPKDLNKYFMIDFNSSVFVIDGRLIPSSTKEKMLQRFKELITNDIEQKFISQYANPSLLRPSYLKLMAEHPELNNARIVRAKNFYEITHLEDGSIRIIITNLSDFYSIDANNIRRHHSYGIETNVIFSYRKAPIIKHSYVIH